MKTTPKISIIIPCYNVEFFIENMFKTLDNQNFSDYEVIFINDGSSDMTEYKIIEYKTRNHRTKLISLSVNIGAGNVRNLGVQHSKGDYLLFLDADDISVEENFLEEVYAKALESNADITMYKTNLYNYQNNTLINSDINWLWSGTFPINQLFTQDEVKNNLFTFCRGALWNKLFKRELITSNNLFFLNTRKHNDTYFVATAIALAKSFYIMDKRLFTYCINRPNSITAVENNHADDCISVNISALKAFLENKGLLDKYQDALEDFIVNFY